MAPARYIGSAGISLAIILAFAMVASAYDAVSLNKTITMTIAGNATVSSSSLLTSGSGGDTGLYKGCYGCIVNRTREAIINWTRRQETTAVIGKIKQATTTGNATPAAGIPPSEAPLATEMSSTPVEKGLPISLVPIEDRGRPTLATINLLIAIIVIIATIAIIRTRPPWEKKTKDS